MLTEAQKKALNRAEKIELIDRKPKEKLLEFSDVLEQHIDENKQSFTQISGVVEETQKDLKLKYEEINSKLENLDGEVKLKAVTSTEYAAISSCEMNLVVGATDGVPLTTTTYSNYSLYGLTGSFLQYRGSYAEMKNLPPERNGTALISLYGKSHEIYVSL